MYQLKFSLFKSQFDMIPQPQALTWPEIVILFTEHTVFDGDKRNALHFNGCEFETLERFQDNVKAMHILVLDYDDGMPLAEAREHFKQYEHVCYTSYNHQIEKDGKAPVDKFRIMIPLTNPCPLQDWLEIRHHVEAFAPGVDMASVRLHQPFAIPLVRSGAPREAWHNEGKWLDWSDWPRQKQSDVFGNATANPLNRSEYFLKPDDILQTKKGSIRVGDINDRIGGVLCPFHGDKSPGEFASKSDKGNIFLHCHKCGTIYMREEAEPVEEFVAALTQRVREREESKPTVTPDDLLEFDDSKYAVEPFNRAQRTKLIERRCLKTRSDIMLMYAFEGFGKSYLAYLKASKGQKVLFASSSNEQAHEQAEGFRQLGLNVQFIPGREYILKARYGIAAQKRDVNNPWEAQRVDERLTKAWMRTNTKYTAEEIDEIWEASTPPDAEWETHQIICTTIARTQSWGQIQRQNAQFWSGKAYVPSHSVRVPSGAVIFFDDPDRKYFTRLFPYDDQYADLVVDGIRVPTVEHGDRKYLVKPEKFTLGFGLFSTQWVFTTTELLTSYLIENLYKDVYKPKLMPDEKMMAGNITMIKTVMVRSKKDGVLPVIAERLRKEKYEFEYIANGQGTRFNLANNKGQNTLSDSDLVVEVSMPHFETVTPYIDELNWTDSDRYTMSLVLALDDAQQAIGRNSGYRWADRGEDSRRRCVVLCEPKLHKALLKTMRYYVETVIDDCSAAVGLKKEYDNLVSAWCWYIRNLNTYLFSGLGAEKNAFLDDVKSYYRAAADVNKLRFKYRLKTALIEIQKQLVKDKDRMRVGGLIGVLSGLR